MPEWPDLLLLERRFHFSWHGCVLPQCHMAAHPGHAWSAVVHVTKAAQDGMASSPEPSLALVLKLPTAPP